MTPPELVLTNFIIILLPFLSSHFYKEKALHKKNFHLIAVIESVHLNAWVSLSMLFQKHPFGADDPLSKSSIQIKNI